MSVITPLTPARAAAGQAASGRGLGGGVGGVVIWVGILRQPVDLASIDLTVHGSTLALGDAVDAGIDGKAYTQAHTSLHRHPMGTLAIRKLDDALKLKLRMRAAARNRSMEEEARQILRAALEEPAIDTAPDLGARIRARFAALGDVELALPPREPVREPPDLLDAAAGRGG
jgi:plasmid stability protein